MSGISALIRGSKELSHPFYQVRTQQKDAIHEPVTRSHQQLLECPTRADPGPLLILEVNDY